VRRPLLLFLAFAASLRAGTPEETLQRALARLRATAANLGRYACIETVEREYFQPSPGGCSAAATAPGRLQAVDRLRLEVTVSAGREIYSWPGATRFDSRDVSEIIRQGPIGTGSFGTHLLAVVDNPAVRFEFAGEQTESGRRFLEYRFTVPLGASRYRVRAGAFTQAVAYHGSFRIDPATLELNRLTFRAEQLPEASSMCALDAELDYNPVPAHGDLLLPVRAELRIGFQDSRQTSNLTTFSSCREYKAESELVFDEVPTAGGAAPAAGRAPQISLPIGLPVTLAFTSPIDTAAAAAGDPVDAKVVRPVGRAGSNAIVIPAGATVHGRLTRVERHLTPAPYFVVAVSFNRLDWEGSSQRFAAHSEPTPELLRQLGIGGSEVAGGMRYWDVGVFVFPAAGTRLVIPAGYQTKWFTLAIRGRS
jgi:hypothetical protein